MRRKVSLLAILAFVTLFATLQFGCSGSDAGDAELDSPLNFDINSPKIRERLGEDDGYAMAIIYGADIHGSLETCG